MIELACNCDAPADARLCDHRSTCAVFQFFQAELGRRQVRIDRRREDRAAGRKRWSSAVQALHWWVQTRASKASARALTIGDDNGSGRPNRGLDAPVYMQWAAVTGAVKVATLDDRERHPAKPAPLERWIVDHFGYGRACSWISEETNGRWSEPEVMARLERALRVVRDRLREGGWVDGG